MIRELGHITAISNGQVTIQTQLKSGCSGCAQQRTCGAGILSKAFPQRRGEFIVPNPHLDSTLTQAPLAVGQAVELELPEEALSKFSLAVYLLPLLALIAGAAVGHKLNSSSELLSIALGFSAFGCTFWLLRRYLKHRDVKIRAMLQVKSVQ